MKPRNTYERVAVVPMEIVLHTIRENMKRTEKATPDEPNARRNKERVPIAGHPVKVSGVRLETFALHGTDCSCCGIKGAFFAIERQMHQDIPYHLNLWALEEDGNEVLMTHDHTLARGLGGKDSPENTTTMCTNCNSNKAIAEQEEYNRRIGKKDEQKR